MPNFINELMLSELEKEIEDMEGGVFVDFSGINVAEVNELRAKFDESKVRYRVLKNRIANIAFKKKDLELGKILEGPTAFAFGSAEQAIGAAKIIQEASKTLKKLRVKGGLFEDEVLDARAAAGLAKLPDRHRMRAMIATAILDTPRRLATVIREVPCGLARCLQARVDKAQAPD